MMDKKAICVDIVRHSGCDRISCSGVVNSINNGCPCPLWDDCDDEDCVTLAYDWLKEWYPSDYEWMQEAEV